MSKTPGKTAMDQFVDCWEGLEDPRTGNAGLHDFHELLMIALCTVRVVVGSIWRFPPDGIGVGAGRSFPTIS